MVEPPSIDDEIDSQISWPSNWILNFQKKKTL